MTIGDSTLIRSRKDEEGIAALAAAITWGGSKQSYYTIRWLVDGDLVDEAMCAYAYFRWLDDVLDASPLPRHDRLAFLARQKSLLTQLCTGRQPTRLGQEEELLAELISHERREHGGLRSYLRNMMAVMAFDARRRGRVITRGELNDYTETLAMAVMDGLSYFIGNDYEYPDSPARYLAVAGAHVSHMLRDAVEDSRMGYFNIPREVLEGAHISPADVDAPAYREWVAGRVTLARRCFRDGKRYILGLKHARAVLAGLAYCARFERVLSMIERDGYRLRSDYRRDRTIALTREPRRRAPRPMPPARSPVADLGWPSR
jgi:phytoene/squalene synthetase